MKPHTTPTSPPPSQIISLAWKLGLLGIAFCALTACSGYHLGGNKPAKLQHVKSIAIPLIKNDTQFPKAAAALTNHLTDALTHDGTYKLGHLDSADAQLNITLRSVNYSLFRPTQEDLLRAEEQEMEITVNYELLDSKNGGTSLTNGEVRAKTSYFVGNNIQIAHQNALPDALKRASTHIISRLADGF